MLISFCIDLLQLDPFFARNFCKIVSYYLLDWIILPYLFIELNCSLEQDWAKGLISKIQEKRANLTTNGNQRSFCNVK